MSAATSHPLAAAYLRDLELLLHGLDPGSRAEVLAGVREHLTAAVGPDATGDQVQAALTQLGPPQGIADEAYAEQPGPSAPPQPPRWQAVLASAINVMGLGLVVLGSMAAAGASGIMALASLLLLPWTAVVALSLLSPVWAPRQKVASIVLLPATVVGLSLIVALLLAVFGPSPVNAVPALALLAGAAWVLFRLVRTAVR